MRDENRIGRLLLVRHGESEGNALRRFTESEQVPLTPKGREQAERAAALLRARFAPVGIVSSPFTRAHQTAEIIASTLELPIEIEPGVREQFLGELHGQPYDAALATPGFETLPRWEWRPPAGETLLEVQQRAVGALLRIAGAWVGADVVVTSHAGTIQSCWAHVARDWQAAPHVPNCGVVVIEHDGRNLARPELILTSS